MPWLLQGETLIRESALNVIEDSRDNPKPSLETELRLKLYCPLEIRTGKKNRISGEDLRKEVNAFIFTPAGLDWIWYFARNPNRYPEEWKKGEGDENLYVLYPRRRYKQKPTGFEQKSFDFEIWPYTAWHEDKIQLEVGLRSLNNEFFSNHRVLYIK